MKNGNRLIMTVLLLVLMSVQGKTQTSELEILGRSQEPFLLKISGVMQEDSPCIRFLSKGLSQGSVAIEICFSDTTLGKLVTNVHLESDYRMVYRVVKQQQTLADPVSFFKKLLGRKGVTKEKKPTVWDLKLIEKLYIIQESMPDKAEQKDTSRITLVHGGQYRFTKEQPNTPVKPAKSDSEVSETSSGSSSDTLSPADKNSSSAPRFLTASEHQQLIKQLTLLKFEEERRVLVNQTLPNTQFTTQQLVEILQKFDFERTKIELCKKYYFYLTDKKNASALSGVFEFHSTQTEIKQWIDEQTR